MWPLSCVPVNPVDNRETGTHRQEGTSPVGAVCGSLANSLVRQGLARRGTNPMTGALDNHTEVSKCRHDACRGESYGGYGVRLALQELLYLSPTIARPRTHAQKNHSGPGDLRRCRRSATREGPAYRQKGVPDGQRTDWEVAQYASERVSIAARVWDQSSSRGSWRTTLQRQARTESHHEKYRRQHNHTRRL